MTGAVLRQLSGLEWQTTVLVDDVGGSCPAGSGNDDDYSLDVTGPDTELTPVSATSTTSATRLAAFDPALSSCEVTLDFAGLRQVPMTATLVLDGSSSIRLSR